MGKNICVSYPYPSPMGRDYIIQMKGLGPLGPFWPGRTDVQL